MKAKQKLLIALTAAAIGLGTSASVMARDSDRHQRHHEHHHGHHHNHWQHDHRGYGHVLRERVVVERPVYVERYVQYVSPPPLRNPAIVVRVDLPPFVISLR